MHAGVKMIIGVILILAGLWLLVPSSYITAVKPASMAVFDWWDDFLIMLKGIIPPMIILFGVLIVWIESEELKTPEIPEIDEPEIEEPKKKPKRKSSKKARKKRRR